MATKINKSIGKPLLDYGHILRVNATDKINRYTQTTEEIALRLITVITKIGQNLSLALPS